MSFWRFLLIIPASCLVWTAAWFLWPANSSSSQAAPARAADLGATDKAATQLLQSAIDRLHAPQACCLETTVWQRGNVQGVNYEAEGRYLSAPRGRIRLELQTRCGDATGKLQLISDGTRMLRAIAKDGEAWTEASFVDAWAIVDRSGGKISTDQVRQKFLQGHSGRGPVELLENSLAQFTWIKATKVKRAGRIYFKLTGLGRSADREPADSDDQISLVQQCRLYLDVNTLWPCRIEWWGSESSSAPLALLFQLEYRDPVLLDSLTADRLATEFGIDTQAYPLLDQTETIAGQLLP